MSVCFPDDRLAPGAGSHYYIEATGNTCVDESHTIYTRSNDETFAIPSSVCEFPWRVLLAAPFHSPNQADLGSHFGRNASSRLFFVLGFSLGNIFVKFFPRLFNQILIFLHLVGQALFDRWHDFRPQENNQFLLDIGLCL